MIETILFVGVGIIIALAGVILLDGRRFDRAPRHAYRAAIAAGVVLSVIGILL